MSWVNAFSDLLFRLFSSGSNYNKSLKEPLCTSGFLCCTIEQCVHLCCTVSVVCLTECVCVFSLQCFTIEKLGRRPLVIGGFTIMGVCCAGITLSLILQVCLCVFGPMCICVCLSVHVSLCVCACLFVCPPMHLCLYMCACVCVCAKLCICVFVRSLHVSHHAT